MPPFDHCAVTDSCNGNRAAFLFLVVIRFLNALIFRGGGVSVDRQAGNYIRCAVRAVRNCDRDSQPATEHLAWARLVCGIHYCGDWCCRVCTPKVTEAGSVQPAPQACSQNSYRPALIGVDDATWAWTARMNLRTSFASLTGTFTALAFHKYAAVGLDRVPGGGLRLSH